MGTDNAHGSGGSCDKQTTRGFRLREMARVPAADARGDEHLVAVRREVLTDVEHAVGNLLQRMHHAARAVAPSGDRLHGTLDDLERLLELLFDYVSPVEVALRPTDAGRVVESLAAQFRAQGGTEVTLGELPRGVQVLADPRLLTRSFALLARAHLGDCAPEVAVMVDVAGVEADRVEFRVRLERDAAGSPYTAMAAAVAGRLIELQGGELSTGSLPGVVLAVTLPAVVLV